MNRKPKFVVVTIASLISTTLLLTACEQSLSGDDYSLSITEPNLKAEAVVIKEADDYFEGFDVHQDDENETNEDGKAIEIADTNPNDTDTSANGTVDEHGTNLQSDTTSDNDAHHDASKEKEEIKNIHHNFELNLLAHLKNGYENERIRRLKRYSIEWYEKEYELGNILSPMEIYYYNVDLNGNGADDYIIMTNRTMENSGYFSYDFEIFIYRYSRYIRVFLQRFSMLEYISMPGENPGGSDELNVSIRVLPNVTNGYHDVFFVLLDDLSYKEGSEVYVECLLQFDGDSYEPDRLFYETMINMIYRWNRVE
ncbi:MAG: hypothetical protein LBC96_04100 [Lachnospiraceae bacterium]|nr:hypothetical protein [Lachnospiraceae bacterium]